MCEPISITLGVLSAGLGIAQGVAGYQQAQENVAMANAQAEQNYRFQQMQANAARSFERLRQQQQQSIMEQNRYLADRAYENDISQLNLRIMQEQQAAAERTRQAGLQAQQAQGEVRAAGRMGLSVDNLIADYYRQQAVFDYATERNLAFTTAQVQQEKVGAAARRGSRIASQQPYLQQPVLSPLEPIYQSAPSALPYVLQGAAGVVGGVQTGMSTYGQIRNIRSSQPPRLPPVPGTQGGNAFNMPSLAPGAGTQAPNFSSYLRRS